LAVVPIKPEPGLYFHVLTRFLVLRAVRGLLEPQSKADPRAAR